jgi:hypothetical protein
MPYQGIKFLPNMANNAKPKSQALDSITNIEEKLKKVYEEKLKKLQETEVNKVSHLLAVLFSENTLSFRACSLLTKLFSYSFLSTFLRIVFESDLINRKASETTWLGSWFDSVGIAIGVHDLIFVSERN